MRKQLLLFLCILFVGSLSYGQKELLKGGNMENASAWTFSWASGYEEGSYEFNYTTDIPTAGDGGCYRITSDSIGHGIIWQSVTITPGHKYTLTGAFKNIATDDITNSWVELILTRTEPTPGSDFSSGTGDFKYELNTWYAPDTLDIDGTFQDLFILQGSDSDTLSIPDTVTDVEWFVVLKTGIWNEAENSPTMDYLVDEISLMDISIQNPSGNMENASAWTFSWASGYEEGSYEFNYTGDTPAYGEGGCYRITADSIGHGIIWQPVTVIPGHMYSLNGAFKNIATDDITNSWVELILTRTEPTPGSDFSSGTGDFKYELNTWYAPDTLDIDGTFQDLFILQGSESDILLMPDTITDTDWFIVLKTGIWNETENSPTMDYLVDEIYLSDLGPQLSTELPIENIVFGSVDNADDYTGTVTLTWDTDSIYMVFDIVDDSIVNTGASYQCDNIEIYFDMDNSKNIHYPRNGGWVASVDEAYDDNDWQLRLVPDVDFATNNTARPSITGGYNQIYTETENGYQFILNILWDSLMVDFAAESGTEIGFDVLLSDNDDAGAVTDANRNQITWNSPTDKPFNDPSLFGTLRLNSTGNFTDIQDQENPTNVSSLAATVDGSDVELTWDPATDDRVVQYYIIYDGSAALDTILAKETGNSYTVEGLADGEYTLGVAAMDVYGKKSGREKVDVTITTSGLKNLTADLGNVYPNPSNGIFNIETVSSELTSLKVYNLTGAVVFTDQFVNNYKLDLSEYAAGIYFLHLSVEKQNQIVKLFVE